MIEKLAVERVVACYLETCYVDAMHHPYTAESYLPRARFQLKLKESAHKRYLSALKSLTQLQKAVGVESKPKLTVRRG